jgi:hypothetical protein
MSGAQGATRHGGAACVARLRARCCCRFSSDAASEATAAPACVSLPCLHTLIDRGVDRTLAFAIWWQRDAGAKRIPNQIAQPLRSVLAWLPANNLTIPPVKPVHEIIKA